VVDLRTISPLDEATVLESVGRTGRLVVVHDAAGPFGPGAEVAALVAEHAFDALRAPVARVAAPFAPAPFAKGLEHAYYPTPERIAAAARAVVGEVPVA
jgi:pyruvate dehydrogenase E1 component beta subunit